MKGLLHRLATRAAGTAPLLRPDRSAAYAGGAGTWEPAVAAVPPGLAGEARRGDEEEGGPAPVVEPLPGRPAMQRKDSAIGPASAAPIAPPALLPAQALPAVPMAAPDASAARGAESVHAASVRPAFAPSPAAASFDSLEARSEAPRRDIARPARPSTPTLHPATSQPPTLAPRLLPEAAPAQTASPLAALPTGMSPASGAGTAEDTAEVHIHIGRIEVRAVQEQAAPRRKTAAAPPVSLDAYLAGRRRP
ncbi:hypothetical protein [Xylophilus sp. GOD-11R]|uniref:hypothetical protein n=1 Tax=Xylophilus sp. GOD-11R TaxID=3089814 RepID=UPI00298D096F|nr:hypothetical protein [Xylophilus sp. GOD-11R]WPB55032.1 hypothetical protein R9X41_12715 [Xylophilus sp. GOD-11R]